MPSSAIARQRNDPAFPGVWDELVWRGLVQVSTDEVALRAVLGAGPVVAYCGFDPTAPSLHLGNLVQLLVLRRLQLAGHLPLGLVGGSTGLIGDPRPSAERTLHDRETVAAWVDSVASQLEGFLDFTGPSAARMVNNLEWTADLSAIDFLRDIGKHFRVGTMLRKDAVAARLNSPAGISYTEFSYQVLQGFDYLQLHRRYGCVLQTGGSDQWGNLTAGIDLVHRVEGATVHALGTPLILNSDGTKFGKSEGNAVWLDPDLTSPYAFFQFWLNTADADVVDRLKVFTFLTREEIEALAREVADRPYAREAQRRLAWEVTATVHGDAAADGARDAGLALFGSGDLAALPEPALAAAVADLPNAEIDPGSTVAQALLATGVASSLSDARRAIEQGGVAVNNERVAAVDAVLPTLLHGRYGVLRRGKRTLAVITTR